MFLKSGVAVFTFQVAAISSSPHCLTSGEKYLPSSLLVILRLSQSFCGYTCSVLLAPSCGRILKLVYRLSIPQSLAMCLTTSVLLPGVGSLPGPGGQASFCACSVSVCKAPLGCLWERAPGVRHGMEGCVGEVCEVLGVPEGQLMGLQARCPSGSWADLPMASLTRLVGSMSSPYVPFCTPAAVLPAAH